MNITIIAAIFISLFHRLLGLRRGILLAGLGIAFYTILVGADAAVVRASIMGGVTLLARILGRGTHDYRLLFDRADPYDTINPHCPMGFGFQLSFAATLGLNSLFPSPGRVSSFEQHRGGFRKRPAKKLAPPINEFILFTLAAQITTLPLTVYYFQRFPLSSLIANPVILPVQPPLMILGGIATLAGMLWIPIGRSWLGLHGFFQPSRSEQ